MSMEREELHRIIDKIPEDKLHELSWLVKRVIESDIDDPVRRALAKAPLDDEPLTDEERERIERAYADFKSGNTLSMDELKKELGL